MLKLLAKPGSYEKQSLPHLWYAVVGSEVSTVRDSVSFQRLEISHHFFEERLASSHEQTLDILRHKHLRLEALYGLNERPIEDGPGSGLGLPLAIDGNVLAGESTKNNIRQIREGVKLLPDIPAPNLVIEVSAIRPTSCWAEVVGPYHFERQFGVMPPQEVEVALEAEIQAATTGEETNDRMGIM